MRLTFEETPKMLAWSMIQTVITVKYIKAIQTRLKKEFITKGFQYGRLF